MSAWRFGRRQPRPANVSAAACAACAAFRNDPAGLETALPGLAALGSGWGATRGDDGLCLQHDRFVSARAICGAFRPRSVS